MKSVGLTPQAMTLGEEAGGVADGAGVEVLGDPAEGDGGFLADAAGDLDFAGIAFAELAEGSLSI